jgi:hypothetical protein
MIFQLTNGFYHSKQVWKPIKYYVLINEDPQITESCQEASSWAVALNMRWMMKKSHMATSDGHG